MLLRKIVLRLAFAGLLTSLIIVVISLLSTELISSVVIKPLLLLLVYFCTALAAVIWINKYQELYSNLKFWVLYAIFAVIFVLPATLLLLYAAFIIALAGTK